MTHGAKNGLEGERSAYDAKELLVRSRLYVSEDDPTAKQIAKLRIIHGTKRAGGLMFVADFAIGYELPRAETILYNARLLPNWMQKDVFDGTFREDEVVGRGGRGDRNKTMYVRYEPHTDKSVDCWILQGDKADVEVGRSRLELAS